MAKSRLEEDDLVATNQITLVGGPLDGRVVRDVYSHRLNVPGARGYYRVNHRKQTAKWRGRG